MCLKRRRETEKKKYKAWLNERKEERKRWREKKCENLRSRTALKIEGVKVNRIFVRH